MRGTGVAKGVREGSVGNPELQLMLKEKCYGLNFRVLLLKTKPNQLQKSKTRRELTTFAIRLQLAARGAPAALDGHPRLAPGGKREPLHTAGDSRDTAPARQEHWGWEQRGHPHLCLLGHRQGPHRASQPRRTGSMAACPMQNT